MPAYSPTTAELRRVSGSVKGGRERLSLVERLSKIDSEHALDVSNYMSDGARKIKSPKAGLTRVNSKGNEVIVPRSKFPLNSRIVSNNAASYAAAMYEIDPSRSRSQYEREWMDSFRQYEAAAAQSKANTEARKSERPATARPPTGKPRGRPKGSKNKAKLMQPTAYVGRPASRSSSRVASQSRIAMTDAIVEAAEARVEADIARSLSRSSAQHSAAARSLSRSASPIAVPVVRAVASPRSASRSASLRAAGL
jgi:hypothetical protein